MATDHTPTFVHHSLSRKCALTFPPWNTALPRLPQFLAALQRNDFLFSQTKSALSLYTRGYILDPKGRKAPPGAASRLRTCRCSVRVCIAANAKPLAVVAERCRFAGIAHVGALHCRLSIGCAHSEGGVNHSDGVVENA